MTDVVTRIIPELYMGSGTRECKYDCPGKMADHREAVTTGKLLGKD